MSQEANTYDDASAQTVELGNRLADDETVNPGEIADGLLAGAIQYWLYSRQPCGDPGCEDCATLCTADRRLDELLTIVRELAETSEYYHSPHDHGVGRA
ncbi:MAG: hypothetical protein L0H73_05235 [Nitrococcus sp.]|nr:hypothetical protein [Nitrococcus sp.]